MQHTSRMWVAAIGVSMALLSAGCKSGGSGLSGLFGIFGGGSDSGGGGGEVLASLINPGSDGPSFNPPVDPVITPSVDAVHNPEPGSIALFGTGLLGAAFLRRRRKAHRS